jgi:type III pantothenate kinase
MSPNIVVDIGNGRNKWGRCSPDAVIESASLPDEPETWQRQLDAWQLAGPLTWAVSSVRPAQRARFAEWLAQRGDRVLFIESARQIPLTIALEQPDKVGIDRLVNALAVARRQPPALPAVVVDAGTAITVDWVDETGAFRGGAIMPGLWLMARSLHEHTSLLPLVDVAAPPTMPGTSTESALHAGIFWSAAGGVHALVELLRKRSERAAPCSVFLTGGDAALLATALDQSFIHWPTMTLEGIRLAAQASES